MLPCTRGPPLMDSFHRTATPRAAGPLSSNASFSHVQPTTKTAVFRGRGRNPPIISFEYEAANAEGEHFPSGWLYGPARHTRHANTSRVRFKRQGGTHVLSRALMASLSSKSLRFLSLAALITFMVLCRSRSLRASNTRSFHTIRDISCTKYTCCFRMHDTGGRDETKAARGGAGAKGKGGVEESKRTANRRTNSCAAWRATGMHGWGGGAVRQTKAKHVKRFDDPVRHNEGIGCRESRGRDVIPRGT